MAEPFIRVVPDPEDEPERQHVQEIHGGQLRFAERFAHTYRGRLMYVHKLGWFAWTGTHWQEDSDGAPTRAVADLLKDAWAELGALDGEARKQLLRDITRCESANGIAGVLAIAGSLDGITAAVDDLDADPDAFNVLNGTVDLRTGQIREHDPADRITRVAGARLDPDARSERWETFLGEVLPDRDVREFFRRVCGQALRGAVEEHILPIVCGTGRNGKGVAYDTVLAAFGKYGSVCDPKVVMASKHQLHGTFLVDLMGKRLVVTSETNEGSRLDAAIVKRLTGGDKLQANRMHRDPFEFRPSHTIILVTNHRPATDANDAALWARLRVVPFDQVIPEERRDHHLGDKLREHDLDAVLAWIWQGWLDYRRIGLAAPEVVTQRTDEYRAEGDVLGAFLADECVTGLAMRVGASELFRQWQQWSVHNGVPAMTQPVFGRLVEARGFERRKSGGTKVYIGLGLAAEDEEAGQHVF